MLQSALQRNTVIGFFASILLSVVKLAAGVWGLSSALVADAVESLADTVGSVLVWQALRVASKPPDKNHPYGYGKAEALAILPSVANVVITDKLADSVSDADLAKAVEHNEEVEEKLREAGEKLQVVTDLLDSEERDQQRMEQAAREADGTSTPGARSGAGSASVIEHLRELTRHRVTPDVPEPGRAAVPGTGKKPARTPRPA